MCSLAELRQAAASALLRAWTRRGFIARLLLPVTWLYTLLSAARRGLYTTGACASHRANTRVLVVGNVIAGGAGKTPTVIALVQHLMACGIQVGVVSRGHARQAGAVQRVVAGMATQDTGDEPQLIFNATAAPVVVGVHRAQAVQELLRWHPSIEVVVCDDGLQHYALYRDLEVCVFDDRGLGNGYLLPAGPLRESWPRKAVARCGQDKRRLLVLHTGKSPAFAGFRAKRQLAPHALRASGETIALAQLAALKPLLAVAGIAQPLAFFSDLHDAGLAFVQCIALDDHHVYSAQEVQRWSACQIVCTEKDARKIWQFAPDAIAVPLIQTMEPDFYAALHTLLDPLLATKLSSPHGPQTT